MALTPTYSWPLPDDTDLVKDGAEAIRDLGNAIDATVSSVPTGLVHINTTTFTGVSAVNLDNVFSANYENYKIIVQFTTTAAGGSITYRMRAAGTDNSSANYMFQRISVINTSVTGARSVSQTSSAFFAANGAANENLGIIELSSPFLAKATNHIVANSIGGNSTTLEYYANNGGLNVASSFDGITFFIPVTAWSGKISVYGYRF
jgi:hypothetical protein